MDKVLFQTLPRGATKSMLKVNDFVGIKFGTMKGCVGQIVEIAEQLSFSKFSKPQLTYTIKTTKGVVIVNKRKWLAKVGEL